MNDLIAINDLTSALLRSVAPDARRTLLRQIARDIRKSQSDRIARQVQPDGQPFAPRKATGGKARKGRLRDRVMFKRLRLAKFLKAGAEPGEAWVGFAGRAAAIARVHQEGLNDVPARGAKKVRYAQRILLGLTDAEQDMILDRLLSAVAP